MRFVYGAQDFHDGIRGQEGCYLLTNGLGGFSSQNLIGGASRNDHAVLMACTEPPNHRWNLIHRLEEQLEVGAHATHLSSQQLADGTEEQGWRQLSTVEVDGLPQWQFRFAGVTVTKVLALGWEENTLAVRYRIENESADPCTLTVVPWMQFVPKGEDLSPTQTFQFTKDRVESAGLRLYVRTGGRTKSFPTRYQTLFYAYDMCDGRRETGRAAANHAVFVTVAAGRNKTLDVVYALDAAPPKAAEILRQARKRCRDLQAQSGLRDPAARQLALSADAFIARRGTHKTILAGYPFFADWGRDTMIAFAGCTLSTGRYADARDILETFARHEREGLMPNLFPEGENAPLYNTADAALLFLNCVWLYFTRTHDLAFVRTLFPVMERIAAGYQRGTAFGIYMDTDGLICAGQGLDQVTWMDVRIGEVLPTPRHGKPVEINAYWYNGLRILERLAPLCGGDGAQYGALAAQVQASFVERFWLEEGGYLRDLVSGTDADTQIRCNQIWALSLPFTMLSEAQEARVLQTVTQHLYTPVGLRTLSPADAQFHPNYGGAQETRDLAYHQGTVWPFPLGAYYLACLKVYGKAAKRTVRQRLTALLPALREGCAGQLPEIYDGRTPTASRGCFAQAWSVSELLRVYEALERME